jgi:alpha-methylacyl-CoA racemase
MGPLDGYTIVEMGGIGPGPFCAMLLADMGADVIRISRPRDPALPPKPDATADRGIRAVTLDLKTDHGRETALAIIKKSDALIEGFRPGVMERLGLGPDVCLGVNPALVFGRMTGWGQDGRLSKSAGHDINYLALTGALHAIGTKEKPIPPLNLVADFGGGAMFLAFGVVCALLEAAKSQKGQVVDAAMTDGASMLMAMVYAQKNAGKWVNERESNVTDCGTHYYGTYKCRDGKWVSIGAIEPQFYAMLLDRMGLDPAEFTPQHDTSRHAEWTIRFAEVFASKTRDEWCALLEGSDVCFAPVLDLDEAPLHSHLQDRTTFVEVNGGPQPAPAPRFSRTKAELRPKNQQTSDEVLQSLGLSSPGS